MPNNSEIPTEKRFWKRPRRILVGVLSALLVIGSITAFSAYRSISDSVQAIEVDRYLDEPPTVESTESPEPTPTPTQIARDPFASRSVNILIVGTDVREDDNDQGRSDTTIVLNLSEDRKEATAISIPRDSMVRVPACKRSDGSWTAEESLAMFNSAFSKGDNPAASVACTIRTIEENADIQIDASIIIDFAGFEDLVDALGGVEVDVPHPMVSPNANLDLEAGIQRLNGEQALGFARARTFTDGYSDGSDLERIERQKILMEAIVNEALSKNLFSNTSELYALAEAGLEATTVSENLGSIQDLIGFARSVRSLDSGSIDFETVPVTAYPQDPNRVIWTDEATELWESLS